MNTKDVSLSWLLLEAGADPNIVSKEGVGPLFFAIKTQNSEAIRLLIEFGAEIWYKTGPKLDRSPVFIAILDENKSFF